MKKFKEVTRGTDVSLEGLQKRSAVAHNTIIKAYKEYEEINAEILTQQNSNREDRESLKLQIGYLNEEIEEFEVLRLSNEAQKFKINGLLG